MKTMDLLMGLVRLLGAAGLCFVPLAGAFEPGSARVVINLLCILGAVVNAWCGVYAVMEACFGRNGLIREVFPEMDSELD